LNSDYQQVVGSNKNVKTAKLHCQHIARSKISNPDLTYFVNACFDTIQDN